MSVSSSESVDSGGGKVDGRGGGGDDADELVSEPGPCLVLGMAPALEEGPGLFPDAKEELVLRPDPLAGSGRKLELADEVVAETGCRGADASGTWFKSGSESGRFFSASNRSELALLLDPLVGCFDWKLPFSLSDLGSVGGGAGFDANCFV